MKKDLKYFMREKVSEIVTVPGPESFKDEKGNVIQFEVRVLTQKEINDINKMYRRRTPAMDKKGNPIVSNGEVVWRTERDNETALRHMIVDALVYPDLKNEEMMSYYGVIDFTDMPLAVFSKPDEYAHVANIVLEACGITEKNTDEDDLNDAKK